VSLTSRRLTGKQLLIFPETFHCVLQEKPLPPEPVSDTPTKEKLLSHAAMTSHVSTWSTEKSPVPAEPATAPKVHTETSFAHSVMEKKPIKTTSLPLRLTSMQQSAQNVTLSNVNSALSLTKLTPTPTLQCTQSQSSPNSTTLSPTLMTA
jgi:hypothetical protein